MNREQRTENSEQRTGIRGTVQTVRTGKQGNREFLYLPLNAPAREALLQERGYRHAMHVVDEFPPFKALVDAELISARGLTSACKALGTQEKMYLDGAAVVWDAIDWVRKHPGKIHPGKFLWTVLTNGRHDQPGYIDPAERRRIGA